MPKFAALAVLFAMANCGLPGTAGFVGEWMVILGAVQFKFWIAAVAASTMIWGAAYTLWMVKRVYFGPIANAHVRALKDVNPREFAMLGRPRRGRARDGHLSEALHQCDARLRLQPAAAGRQHEDRHPGPLTR